MNETIVAGATCTGIVIIVLSIAAGMTYHQHLEAQITIEAMKNGYEQQQVPNSTRVIWVKVPAAPVTEAVVETP